ncbi:hypothetical protein K469DRAFT_700627 [Zopfia rhizophila CBS 207.26]|uniref:DUF1330 domain-containing protein n=1 Tax=Zopfia rhizophila CBS 207.26 TaxID=1314779 RepID=A0A6A6EH46_9PEZI|nr:hypothetical protein K469DRAFT_700627 [Zopfia rhizophila CBS 207.26]
MTSTLIDYTKLSSISTTFDPSKPIYMLNLLRYRPTATYLAEHSALAGEPCTGREAYFNRYRPALAPLMPPNAAPIFIGAAIAGIVSPHAEKWDVVAIVRYESLEGFKKMCESEEYKKTAMPHRLAALQDWRLILCDKLDG